MKLEEQVTSMAEDRARIESILRILDRTVEPASRAELATELVRFVARYEDTRERALYPALHGVPGAARVLAQAEHDGRAVRDAMSAVHQRVKHVEPAYAHADDPIGFELVLDDLIETIRREMAHEDSQVAPLVDAMEPVQREELLDHLARASAHASSHPNPPHSRAGRAVATAIDTVERHVHDRSTPSPSGLTQLVDDERSHDGS